MKKAYSYVRFSTPDQKKGDSLRRQIAASKAWCERNGLHLDQTLRFHDLGVSAFTGRNVVQGKLGAFLKAVDEGVVASGSVLIVESLDRLSRQQVLEAFELFLGILNRGITIVSLNPEEVISTESANKNFVQLIIVIVILSRAYEESATKSNRLQEAWKQKRKCIETRKLTKMGPKWCRLESNEWVLVPDKVEVVRRIFELAIAGYGADRIVKHLNQATVPAFRSGRDWHRSSVMKLLKGRAVLGEFTPRRGRGGTTLSKRPIAGETIANYYPQIIDEATFYAAQKALSIRRNQRGPTGTQVTNLFTGLLVCGYDTYPLTVVDKGRKSSGPQLVSSGAARGVNGCKYISFPYDDFELCFLKLCADVDPSDLFPKPPQDKHEAQLNALEGQLCDVDHRLGTYKERLLHDPEFATLLCVVKELENRRVDIVTRINVAKRDMAHGGTETLHEVQDMITTMHEATEAELVDFRLRLKSRIASLVDKIVVWVDAEGNNRTATACIDFHRGEKQWLHVLRRTTHVRRGSVPVGETITYATTTAKVHPVPHFAQNRKPQVSWDGGGVFTWSSGSLDSQEGIEVYRTLAATGFDEAEWAELVSLGSSH